MTPTLFQTAPTIIAFSVHGVAQAAGSKRGFAFKRKDGGTGVAISDANPKSREWKNYVAATARANYSGPLLRGPLKVYFAFVVPRPKGHYGSKGVRASAPGHPAVKPDLLKLARGVEDALTSVLWNDDAQIVEEYLSKRYGNSAYVEIRIEPIV